MNEIFNIRPKPFEGESLSSYIMRISYENHFGLNSILNKINLFDEKTLRVSHYPYWIDINPKSKINMELLSVLAGVDKDILESMAFATILKKFTDNFDNRTSLRCGLKKYFIKDYKRFCPICLKEYKGYKLIWQISEIEMCDRHMTKLVHKCGVCNTVQSYVSKDLGAMKCEKCGSLLYSNELEYIKDKELINEQLENYKFWFNMLNPNISLFEQTGGLTKEKLLAIKMIYACQIGQSVFNEDKLKKYVDKHYKVNLLKLVNDEPRSYNITIYRLKDFLKNLNLGLEEFLNIKIPNKFIQSLIGERLEPGQCKFVLCRSYGKNSKMKKIDDLYFYRPNYSSTYICTECQMQYGYLKANDKWELILGEDVNRIKIIERVLPLVKNNMDIGEIVKNTDLSYRTVSKAVGYITSHLLADYEIVRKFTPKIQPDNIVGFFKILLNEGGRMAEVAKELFGWNTNEYNYFVSLPEVQNFLIFNSYKKNRRIYKSDKELVQIVRRNIKRCFYNSKDITLENVSERVGISIPSIYRRGLDKVIFEEKKAIEYKEIIANIDRYFLLKEELVEKARCIDIYKFIGKDYRWILSNNPELIEYINIKVKEYNDNKKVDHSAIIKSVEFYCNIAKEAALSESD